MKIPQIIVYLAYPTPIDSPNPNNVNASKAFTIKMAKPKIVKNAQNTVKFGNKKKKEIHIQILYIYIYF